MVASLFSTQLVRYVGRRTLVIYGHLMISAIHLSVGLFNNAGNNTGVLVMILSFLAVYQNTSGPVAWLYAAETTIDVALGICLLTLWGTVFILSLVCPILLKPEVLGASGVFFIFSGISIFGSLYGVFVIKETAGLTDK